MPRSGTKLLREILNKHPFISIPKAESGFIPYYYKKRYSYGDLKKRKNFRKFFDDFRKTSFYSYIENSTEIWNEDKIYNSLSSFDLKEILNQIYKIHAEYEGKIRWGDKSPSYIFHADTIKKIFPNAIFIHIIRDVRDYCLSVRNAWNKNIYRAATKWVNGIEKIRCDLAEQKTLYYELKYENLIENPEKEIESLCKWIGIPFDKKMVDLDLPVENLGSTIGKNFIVKNNYKKWEFGFKKKEIYKIESLTGITMNKLGYVVTEPNNKDSLSRLQNTIYFLSDLWSLFHFRIKALKNPISAARWMLNDLKRK